MSRKIQWSKDHYLALIRGDSEFNVPSLRSIAYGFKASDGFNMHHFDQWTKSQRAKIREVFHRVDFLQAQPKRIVRARGKNLDILKATFHGDVPSKGFKVAFVPDTQAKLTLPGAKKHPPKIKITKDYVELGEGRFKRREVKFNKRALAKDARAEINRAAESLKGSRYYVIQNGQFETKNGGDLARVTSQVIKWMTMYDGKRTLPSTSGNRGDNPKHHNWRLWLDGLVGYRFGNADPIDIARRIVEGRKKNLRQRKKRTDFLKRSGRKGKR